MAERRVAGDGVELAVREWGDPAAPTVVLVHGYPDTSAVWTLVAEALVDHGYRAVAYDVRGAGASDAPEGDEPYRIEHLTADLAAVIDATSPDRPVHLVGHDWGSIQSWDAVTSAGLAGRIASLTSISGPPLDHVGFWLRARLRQRDLLTLLRQTTRSMYVGVFHLPGAARASWALRGALGRTRSGWGRALARVEGARIDDEWPAPTFGTDAARGTALYRANFIPKLRHPEVRRVEVPVQLVVPTKDRFVPGWLFDGLEEVVPDLRRREVPARHWVVRSQPVDVAAWVAAFADDVEAAAAADGAGREAAG